MDSGLTPLNNTTRTICRQIGELTFGSVYEMFPFGNRAVELNDGTILRDDAMPLMRDVLVEWFRGSGDPLNPRHYVTAEVPKWNVPDTLPASCKL